MNIKRTEAFEKLRQKALEKKKEAIVPIQNLDILDMEIRTMFHQIKKKEYGNRS